MLANTPLTAEEETRTSTDPFYVGQFIQSDLAVFVGIDPGDTGLETWGWKPVVVSPRAHTAIETRTFYVVVTAFMYVNINSPSRYLTASECASVI